MVWYDTLKNFFLLERFQYYFTVIILVRHDSLLFCPGRRHFAIYIWNFGIILLGDNEWSNALFYVKYYSSIHVDFGSRLTQSI